MPKTRHSYGVYAWDSTNQYYTACLKWHISFAMTPDEVHDLGLKEVARISADMKKIMDKLGFKGSIADYFKSLEGNSSFYSNDTDKILQEYNDTIFKRINPKLENFFKNIPSVPLEIQASFYDGLGGGYSSASETSPGIFSINLFRPEEVPFFEMMALSLHEANPGHHLQHSYSMKAALPDFRGSTILSFYNIPNWFPYHSAYGEGWALYSEYLGEEMGLYKDDFEMMGRYSYESLRAARLVVDTGLHFKKWSREEAILYLQNHTALTGGSAANEIDRYITWPGQACAYKLGEIKIKDLRQKAQQQLETTQCPVNWHQYEGRSNLRTCLWISDEKASWIDALSWCKLMDGYLVEIGSIGLNSYLQNLINMKQTGKYWIGLTDMEMEMQYVWMNAKVRAVETFFIQGGQGGGRAKNCVNMDEKGMWHAENCKAEFSFICQKNA